MVFDNETLWQQLQPFVFSEEEDILAADCAAMEHVMAHCEIIVPAENRFFVQVNCEDLSQRLLWKRAEPYHALRAEAGLSAGEAARAHTGMLDFSHTTAHFESVIPLGIWGLRERVRQYAARPENTAKQVRFYACVDRAYTAALSFMNRCADEAEKAGKTEMAQSLRALTLRSPETLFEAMQTSIVYYILQHVFDGTYLRTLGRLDALYYPYYIKEQNPAPLLRDFMAEIDRLNAPSNIPFAIGGSTPDGKSAVNELTYALLETYQTVPTHNTKFHVLCRKDTPNDLIEQTFRGIVNGQNSVVFLSDETVSQSLINLGAAEADARNYHIVGCYECGANQELTCSCNARVNLPKALEAALCGGRDMRTNALIGVECPTDYETFEELLAAFEDQVSLFSKRAMAATNIYEERYRNIHSAPILSGTYPSAVEAGGDLYGDYTAKYNNSSVNALGLGTCIDSLVALRKVVYEDKTMTLSEFTAVLRANWEGQEPLRLRIKRKFPKYGLGDKTVDVLAARIVDHLHREISGKPNPRGGVYRLGLFSINWRWEFGEYTAASADGRKHGEPLSQNTGAAFGSDRDGATAHLLSVAAIDALKVPNGAMVDVDLHASAVQGENGIRTLTTTLRTFFDLGGFGAHYNVLNTETLKAAKKDPAAYPNLQVRLCGWNVLFSSLSEKEKDEFIARSERG